MIHEWEIWKSAGEVSLFRSNLTKIHLEPNPELITRFHGSDQEAGAIFRHYIETDEFRGNGLMRMWKKILKNEAR